MERDEQRAREARDRYRPFYDCGTGEVGYLVDLGEETFRVSIERKPSVRTPGEAEGLRVVVTAHDPEGLLVELDDINHFE